MKDRIEAITRLIVALIPAVNIILIQFGKSPLPFTDEDVNLLISTLVWFGGMCWAWWKNNNITFEAQLAQKNLKQLKEDKNKVGGEGDPLEVQ